MEKATKGIRLEARCGFWRASKREGGGFALVATHDRRESQRDGQTRKQSYRVIGWPEADNALSAECKSPCCRKTGRGGGCGQEG
jgi:hypothetical protein